MVHHNSSNFQVSTYVVEMELPPWIMEKTMVDQITPRTFNPSKFEPSTYAVENGTFTMDYGESWAVAVCQSCGRATFSSCSRSNLFLMQPRSRLYLLSSHESQLL